MFQHLFDGGASVWLVVNPTREADLIVVLGCLISAKWLALYKTDTKFYSSHNRCVGEIELAERAERAVVGKEAYVAEEVLLGKQVSEPEEVIYDTARETKVNVEQMPGLTTTSIGSPIGTNCDQIARSNS